MGQFSWDGASIIFKEGGDIFVGFVGKDVFGKVKNVGKVPSYMTKIGLEDSQQLFYANDNYFWLDPGEEKELEINVKQTESEINHPIVLTIESWNVS